MSTNTRPGWHYAHPVTEAALGEQYAAARQRAHTTGAETSIMVQHGIDGVTRYAAVAGKIGMLGPWCDTRTAAAAYLP